MTRNGDPPAAYPLDWNGPVDRAFEAFAPDDVALPIITLFERQVARHGERDALRAPDGAFTYAQIARRVAGLAAVIARETAPGDLVGLFLPTSAAFAVAMMSCFAAGRPFVALDTKYPANWLDYVIADSDPALILVAPGAGHGGTVDFGARRILEVSAISETACGEAACRPSGPDDPACVLYTSGSTGRPKGIVNGSRALIHRAAQSINAAHLGPEDRFLTLASLCTIVGVRDLLTAWLCGGCAILIDAQTAGTREIVATLRADGATVLFAFPALLRLLADHAPHADAPGLRLVRVGGDTTLWRDIDRWRAWACLLYTSDAADE